MWCAFRCRALEGARGRIPPGTVLRKDTNMSEKTYDVLNVEGRRHVKMWTPAVTVADGAPAQRTDAEKLPFIFSHLAAMPDVHVGRGATVGSVIATKGA